jgi:PAS domain S-box-containing protein
MNTRNFAFCQADHALTAKEIAAAGVHYFLTREDGTFHLYDTTDLYRILLEEGKTSVFLRDIPDRPFRVVRAGAPFESLGVMSEGTFHVLLVDEDGDVQAVHEVTEGLSRVIWDARYQIDNLRRWVDNTRRILDVMEDDIFVTDEYGFIQYFNPRSEFLMGIKNADYAGHHISELVKEDILPKSLTMAVLDSGQPVKEIMDLPKGIRIINSAQPIYDDDGKIVQVLSTSKHIDEITDKIDELSAKLRSSDEQIKYLQEQVIGKKQYIFESAPMKEVQKKLMRIAPTDVTVLIEGESGVGKEVVADTIFQLSTRKDKPFVKINCGLIPKDLMESELFGYEAGAFTGALKDGKIGKIEIADKGTVFLDEIGELPLPLQVKLLEFLQDRKITRVGGTKRIAVDIRVIAATNRDLFAMVEEGTFRRDLYYRLNVMPIYIPPLREREGDIVPLLFLFLNMFNKKYGFDRHMDNNVVEKMRGYSWPGNVRELMHTVERIVVSSDSDYIDSILLDELFTEGMTVHGSAITANAKVICTELMPLKTAKHELEEYLVKMAYDRFGSSYKAAEFLQVNQSTVSRWLKRAGERKRKT